MVDGNNFKYVMVLTYLGNIISSNGCVDDEIWRRMAKANASYGRLRQRFWNNHHVSMRVKGKKYPAIVLSTLQYGAEAWTVYIRQVKKLHDFMMRNLRSIMWKNLDGQSEKQGHTRTDRAAIYGRSSDQKESSLDRTPHEDVTK